ncbi:MAG: ABC transporter ATP-binding protein [Sedimentisphaerales bacterium]|nr:ABC transporter ATP-binding protein [Sedimentisphaerales bacterium]
MEYAVETFSLTKIFSDWWGREKVYAVEDLNLKVRDGEVFGLLGPNGSGKTTTLKMLLGLLYPTKGRSVVLSGQTSDPKISARIGFLPEESYLYRYLNARETLDFYGRLFDLGHKVRKMRTEALLDMVGLKAVANRPVGTYSKGMARRIGLAQALINDPDLLILDEPTTGLDPIGTKQIKDLILELARRGKTVLLCSHLLADVEDICDRIAVLYGGRIQSEGNVQELLAQTNKMQITTGSISSKAIETIKEVIANEKQQCVVTSPMDKLETFFIKTVAAAQQAQTTSGAVSTTQIGDFLKAQTIEKSILDKLVSAPVSGKGQAKKERAVLGTPYGEKSGVLQTKPAAPKPDEKLLKRLAEQKEPISHKPVEQAEPVTDQAQQQEKIKKGVLDQLAGKNRQEENKVRRTPYGKQSQGLTEDKNNSGNSDNA